jgi:hypothetical protein
MWVKGKPTGWRGRSIGNSPQMGEGVASWSGAAAQSVTPLRWVKGKPIEWRGRSIGNSPQMGERVAP